MWETITLTQGRVYLSLYWWLLLLVSIALIVPQESFIRSTSKLTQRKYFHAIAIALFAPVRRHAHWVGLS